MNEEALKSVYNDMGFEAQGVSYDKFLNTMETSEDARKSVYSDMGFKSQGVGYDKYEETLGIKKKVQTEETPSDTVSVSEDVSLESPSTDEQVDLTSGFEDALEPLSPEVGFVPTTDYSSQQENVKAFNYAKAKKTVPEALGEGFDYLASPSGVLLDQLPSNLDDQASMRVISENKDKSLNKLSADYLSSLRDDIINNKYSDLDQASALDSANYDIFQDTKELSMASIGLDVEEIAKFKEAISLSVDGKLKVGELAKQLKLEKDPEKRLELIKERAELIESNKVNDKIVSELREVKSGKAFIDAEGNVNKELKEEIGNKVKEFGKEYKTDYNKITDRLTKERTKMEALKEAFLSRLSPELYQSFGGDKHLDPGRRISLFIGAENTIDRLFSEGYADRFKYFLPEGASSEEANKMNEMASSYLNEYKEADKNFQALSRLALLNEDPAAVKRGWGDLSFVSDAVSFLNPGLPEEASSAVQDLAEGAGEIFSSAGETLYEEVTGLDYVSDKDFRSTVVPLLKQEGLKLTKEQLESGSATILEDIGDALGMSGKIALDLASTKNIFKAVKSVPAVAKLVEKTKSFIGNKKIADFAGGLLEESLAFELSNEATSASMGAGEYIAESGFEGLAKSLSKSKYGKFLKYIDSYATRYLKNVGVGGTGAFLGDYTGEFVDQGVKNGFFTEEQYKNTFGEGDEAFRKAIITGALTFGMKLPSSVTQSLKSSLKTEEGQELLADYNNLQKINSKTEEGGKTLTPKEVSDAVSEGDTFTPEEKKEVDRLEEEFKVLARQKLQESNPEVISELDVKMEENSSKRLGISLKSSKRKLEVEYQEEVKEEGDTFAQEISELAKEDNQEVSDYIEMRSAEEISNVLDNNSLLEKVSKNEPINDKQAEEYTNKIYDLIDSEDVVEGSTKESELYDVIEKIENYDNKTETVKKETSKTRLLTRFRENAGQVSKKAFRDQVSGSEVDFKGNKGTVEVEGGSIVFKTEDGSKKLGSATEILTQDFTTDNIIKDESGNVVGVKMDTPSGEITINNPEVGLDLGIQLQEKIVGRNPLKDIEVAYEEVIQEEGIEVGIDKPKVEPVKEVKVEPVKTEGNTFTQEEMTQKLEGSSLKKVYDKIDSLSKKLDDLSLSDPFLITPTVKLVLAGVKKALKAGMTLEQAIKKAKAEAKKSKEYKVLRKEDQNFIDGSDIDTMISKVESEKKAPKRKETSEDDLNLELESLIEESLDIKKPKTSTEVRKIQKRFRDFISANKKILKDASPALNATIANKIASVSSPATLKSTAEYISKIIKDKNFKKEQEARAKLIDGIQKELDPKSFKTKGSAPVSGKIAIEAQGFFEKARRFMGLSKEEASDKYDKILEGVTDYEEISINEKELLLALDFADLENQSTESLSNLAQLVKDYKKEGRKWLALKQEARAKEYKEGQEDLKTAVLAGDKQLDPNLVKSSSRSLGSKIKSVPSDLKKAFESGIAKVENWSGILNHINKLGKKDTGSSQKAKDFLKEKFQKPVEKARSEKMRNTKASLDAIQYKKESIFGKNLKKINQDLQKPVFVKDSKGNEFESSDGKKLSITKDQAMYIYNLQKDSSLSDTFTKMKKTESNKALIEAADKMIEDNPKLKEYADWVHDDFYPNYYNKVNAEYRKQYDFNLPFNEDYSPVKRLGVDEKEIDVLNPTRNIASTLNGSLKERKQNTKDLDISLGMEGSMMGYIDSMEHFITHTDAIKFLNRTFGDPGVKNAISQKAGDTTNQVIDRFIKDLAGQSAGNQTSVEWLQKYRKNYTTAVLGLNPSVFLKQLTSAPAYAVAEGVSTRDYLKETVKTFTTKEGRKDVKDIYNSDYVQSRLKRSGFDRDTALNFKQDFDKLMSGKQKVQDKLMFLTKYGDVGAIIVGGTPYYRSMKKKYKNQGMSESKASDKAMLDFENATESTQQSSSTSELSDLQRGSEIMKMFTMFKTSPAQYLRKGLITPMRNISRGRGTAQDIKNIAMFQVILPSLFTFASKGFMSDEDDAEDYMASIALGNLSGIPFVGDLSKLAVDAFSGKDFKLNSIPALDGVAKLVKFSAKGIAEGEISFEDLLNDIIIPGVEIGTGLPVKNAKKLTIDNLERIGKGDFDQEKLMKYLGYSDYSLGKKYTKKNNKKF